LVEEFLRTVALRARGQVGITSRMTEPNIYLSIEKYGIYKKITNSPRPNTNLEVFMTEHS
jgi:hypothetical protein